MIRTPEEKKKIFSTLKNNLKKKWGEGVIVDDTKLDFEFITTGSPLLDVAFGGGYVRGRFYELQGEESCIAAYSFINYNVRNSINKKLQNSKGGTIEHLYRKFHKIKNGRIRNNPKSKDSIYTVPCMNNAGCIEHIAIKDVVFTGPKPVYRVTTIMGNSIDATLDHKFCTGTKYVQLKDLSLGDSIMIHNNTPFTKKHVIKRYKEVNVKYHPRSSFRLVDNKYPFYRNSVHRLTYEAFLNGFSYVDYIQKLNTLSPHEIDKFIFLPDHINVHHIDEDTLNNDLSNLQLIDGSIHSRLHSYQSHNNLRFIAVEDYIATIEPVGLIDTYDIKCNDPYHNYVANNFIVHNCGKSTLAQIGLAQFQKAYPDLMIGYIDVEHAINIQYSKELGLDTDSENFILTQPSSGEEVIDILLEFLESGLFSAVCVDSIGAMLTKQQLDKGVDEETMGSLGKLFGKTSSRLATAASDSSTTVIWINQLRNKITMFGDPITAAGGKTLPYFHSVRARIKNCGPILLKEIPVGQNIKIKVIKNKIGRPFAEVDTNIFFGVGFDEIKETVDIAFSNGTLSSAGAWCFMDRDLPTQQKWNGKAATLEYFRSNNDAYAALKARTFADKVVEVETFIPTQEEIVEQQET